MYSVRKEDIETPALLIDLDALEWNITKMADFMKDKKAALRPHFKTAKCPAISHMELGAGAKGITCAKLSEAEVLAAAGIKDILIANQIVDPSKVYRLAALAGGSRKITVAVDNISNIDMLSEAAVSAGTEIHVLVEVNVGLNRCGVNSPEEVLMLAERIGNSSGLIFEGLQAYEGHLCFVPEREKRRAEILKIDSKLAMIKAELEKNGIPVAEISGGGTGTYDISGNNLSWTEIQAGSYTLMDRAYDKLELGFKNALSVLTTVIHKRPGTAVTDAGKKACSTDAGEPSVKNHAGIGVVLNEEHGILADINNEFKYLQKIEYVPGHCCTTVNLHDRYYCVRNEIIECIWPVTGRGMSR